ncbi:MAG: hypothetical protein U5N10_08620 [Gemmobacter sp.]|nr:hypothetical protein [Gemmobacter sp.]
MLMGCLYLVVGIAMGSYMGGSGDHSLSPVHAHVNLLGFTLMSIFGLAYRLIPGLAAGLLAQVHFWLHQLGAFVLLLVLYLMMSGTVEAASIGPVFPLSEVAVLAGTLCFGMNLWRHA